ncbi:hypothetical protein EDF87_12514 [Pseudomonas helmanticensis]|uniref:Uncharacterized protein n=1 Tax=Pseudomonas helmanticensis TaxID=1471381 RepID=A0A4R7UR34_9PSED|nr:hypothetical protein [Pseudomonas helmanticensis]TDV37478.1 hypothetical protein EDF87_12514 [Pseudomonas helmanticensis]
MQTFTRGTIVVEFADFSGLMVRHEHGLSADGIRQDRYWVRTPDGEMPLDVYGKKLQVNRGDKISVLYACLPGGALKRAVCVFNHNDSQFTELSDAKGLYREMLHGSASPVPFLLCIATSTIASGVFGWWGAPTGFVVYFLLKAKEAKGKALLINDLGLHMEKLGKRYVREDSLRNVSRLLARSV